jgi:hypothetical protein
MSKSNKVKSSPVPVAPRSNTTSLAAEVLSFVLAKKANDTSPIYFAHTYADDMSELRRKVQYAVQHGDKVRGVVLDYWRASPEGEKYDAQYQALCKVKQPNVQQKAEKKLMLNAMNNVNVSLQRACDTVGGINWLKSAGYTVQIAETAKGTDVYSCYVIGKDEIIPTEFNVTQLRTLGSTKPSDMDAVSVTLTGDKLPVADLRKACDTLKAGTPNDEKGANGAAIEPSKMTAAITQLDTSIERLLKDDGKLASGKPSTEAMDALWARLDSEIPAFNEGVAAQPVAA